MSTHTFLFEEGIWEAIGQFIDADGNIIPLEGKARITHRDDIWINESYTKLAGTSPITIRNIYEIIPFKKNKDFTSWKSVNPDIGTLRGKFIDIGDTILSMFHSEDEEIKGTECLIKIDEITYINRGVIFTGEKKLSSWGAELKRIKDEANLRRAKKTE